MTIHITPEAEFSYVSFESNIQQSSYLDVIARVLETFRPGKFIVTSFANKVITELIDSGMNPLFNSIRYSPIGFRGGGYAQGFAERRHVERIQTARHPVLPFEQLRPDLRSLFQISQLSLAGTQTPTVWVHLPCRLGKPSSPFSLSSSYHFLPIFLLLSSSSSAFDMFILIFQCRVVACSSFTSRRLPFEDERTISSVQLFGQLVSGAPSSPE